MKKLLPPLTKIIKTTPAMSLLYEAIHGIIEGGLLASIEGTPEGDELARLCVGKLRNMVLVEGDPNRTFSCAAYDVKNLPTSSSQIRCVINV